MNVTICIPTYNDAAVLGQAVESALRQTVSPLEVIVIDDGSDPEPNLSVLSKIVRVVRITNRGLPAARNTGLMLAKGEAFLPLDADDTIAPDYIEKTLPLLEAGADVVLTGLQEHGPHRNGRYNPGFDRPWQDVTWELLAFDYNRFFYCALFRTEVLREIGGYHPALAGWPGVSGGYEDWDVWVDLLRRGVKFDAVNEALLNYTTKPDSMLTRAEANRGALVAEIHRHHRLTPP